MTRIKHLALTTTLIFSCALFCSAQEAQTPTVHVTIDSHQAQFTT